ncbi:transposable element Tc1 transposase [Trichonephila clavipes]|nr:transposable element Tc1 transposase [Trichonephila clavipes]
MANRAKFTLVPTAKPPATLACTRSSQVTVVLGSGWNHADWGSIVFSYEYLFQLSPGDHRSRVWRRTGQRADSAFTVARHAGPLPGVMVWGAISFDSRTFWSSLEATCCTAQDKARLHTARVAMNCLTACQALPCPSRSPNLSLIKHVWDMMGRLLQLPGNADDLAHQ